MSPHGTQDLSEAVNKSPHHSIHQDCANGVPALRPRRPETSIVFRPSGRSGPVISEPSYDLDIWALYFQ